MSEPATPKMLEYISAEIALAVATIANGDIESAEDRKACLWGEMDKDEQESITGASVQMFVDTAGQGTNG